MITWEFILGVTFIGVGILSWLWVMITLFRRIITQLKKGEK